MLQEVEQEELLDIKQAAQYKGCSTTTLYNYVKAQRVPDRRGTHGALLFTREDLDNLAIAPPRNAQSMAMETGPVDPAAIRAEILLVSRTLGTIGNIVPGFKRIRQFEEVQPTIRVWNVEVETSAGNEKWQAIYDMNDVRVQRIEEVSSEKM